MAASMRPMAEHAQYATLNIWRYFAQALSHFPSTPDMQRNERDTSKKVTNYADFCVLSNNMFYYVAQFCLPFSFDWRPPTALYLKMRQKQHETTQKIAAIDCYSHIFTITFRLCDMFLLVFFVSAQFTNRHTLLVVVVTQLTFLQSPGKRESHREQQYFRAILTVKWPPTFSCLHHRPANDTRHPLRRLKQSHC